MTSTGRTHATALRVTTLGAVLLAINCGGNSAPPSDQVEPSPVAEAAWGCSQDDLVSTGGVGLLYCFAID